MNNRKSAAGFPATKEDFNIGIDGSDLDSFVAFWENGSRHAEVNSDRGADGSDIGDVLRFGVVEVAEAGSHIYSFRHHEPMEPPNEKLWWAVWIHVGNACVGAVPGVWGEGL